MALTGKQRRHLRALGHHLAPVVQVGQGGVSAEVSAAVDAALATHELIKVKIGDNADGSRKQLARQLAERSGAHLVQVLGRTVLLYRRHPERPRIRLPAAAPAAE
ncbi:MAG: ribosome assembly RNA-binding protein YhbY [Deltaproteobacteria bacterium]|nr:MAG: ribosome assembly RNA-binding protein YhbY [Deltaproteobacteria bacterium]